MGGSVSSNGSQSLRWVAPREHVFDARNGGSRLCLVFREVFISFHCIATVSSHIGGDPEPLGSPGRPQPSTNYSLYLSFLLEPLSNVGGAVGDFYAADLADPQKLNEIHVHERHFRQVQNKPGSVVLELVFQFLDVLRLKVTNETNRSLSAL